MPACSHDDVCLPPGVASGRPRWRIMSPRKNWYKMSRLSAQWQPLATQNKPCVFDWNVLFFFKRGNDCLCFTLSSGIFHKYNNRHYHGGRKPGQRPEKKQQPSKDCWKIFLGMARVVERKVSAGEWSHGGEAWVIAPQARLPLVLCLSSMSDTV